MQLIVVAAGRRPPATERLLQAVVAAADGTPDLVENGERWSDEARSEGGGITAAGIAHAPEALGGQRVHHADGSQVVAFEGQPLSEASVEIDAAWLGERWETLPARLEGIFAAFRLDRLACSLDVLTDPFGILPVYRAALDGGWVLSTSLAAIRELGAGRDLDPQQVAHFIALGWPSARRTPYRGVDVLPGGCVVSFSATGHVEQREHFGVGDLVASARDARPPDAGETAARLTGLLQPVAARSIETVIGLTAGRDSRLVAGLALAAGLEPRFSTLGAAADPDVQFASMLAARLRLPHEIVTDMAPGRKQLPADLSFFARHNDGLSSFDAGYGFVRDRPAVDRVRVMMNGLGGEMARAGTGILTPLAANAGPLSHLPAFQRAILGRKPVDAAGLLRPAGLATARELLHADLTAYRDAGWPSHSLGEAHYLYGRTARWGGTTPRQTAAGDLFVAPLATRAFAAFAFAHSAGQRYLETPHRRLLGALSTDLRDLPFEEPWRPQRARAAPAHLGARLMRSASMAARERRVAPASGRRANAEAQEPWPGSRRHHLDALEQLPRQHPLFEAVDRDALRDALATSSSAELGVLRALTFVWTFADPPVP